MTLLDSSSDRGLEYLLAHHVCKPQQKLPLKCYSLPNLLLRYCFDERSKFLASLPACQKTLASLEIRQKVEAVNPEQSWPRKLVHRPTQVHRSCSRLRQPPTISCYVAQNSDLSFPA